MILDAGTGIRALGHELEREADGSPLHVELFVTHAHWDHVQGLPFFAPLYLEGARVAISSPARLTTSVEQVLDTMMSPTMFPVTRAALRARLSFPRVGEEPVEAAGGALVRALPALHPDGAVGFRVDAGGDSTESIVYFPDNEVRTSHGRLNPAEWRKRFLEFAGGASVLIHDAMYSDSEYVHRVGWGHSTVRDAVELAAEAAVQKVLLFHHAPDRTDNDMDVLLNEAREMVVRLGVSMEVDGAREGATL